MDKKRELDLLRELTVVLCRIGNHIAKQPGDSKRALETKARKSLSPPVKECGPPLEVHGEPLRDCVQRNNLSRLAF